MTYEGATRKRIRALVRRLGGPRSNKDSETKTSDSWWESKMLLLVLGALLTNFLAPRIQDQLETIKWQRQQEVDRERQSIEAMRHFLTDFADLHARSIQLDTLSRSAVMPRVDQMPRRDYQSKFDQLMLDWYAQSAKVSGQLMLFRENGEIRDAFQRYFEETSESLLAYREAVILRNLAKFKDLRSIHSAPINDLYDSVLNLIHDEIHTSDQRFHDQLTERKKTSWF